MDEYDNLEYKFTTFKKIKGVTKIIVLNSVFNI